MILKLILRDPKLLSFWETGTTEIGVHRFAYNGGDYVHMPAECPGFVGFIVRILDISDPSNPKSRQMVDA